MIALVSGAGCILAVEHTKRLCRAEEERRNVHRLIEWKNALAKSGGGEGFQIPGK